MRTVREVLRTADPLRHEPSLLEAERKRLRRAIRARVPVTRTKGMPRFRLSVATITAALAIVAALGSMQFWSARANLQAAVRFEVHLAEEEPGPGLREARVGKTERVVYLHPQPIASNGDVMKSIVVDGDQPGRSHVVVEFSSAAAERMRRATSGHIGKPMAVLIEGEVVAAPVVRSPIGQSALISGDFTKPEAERIAKGIRVP
jgi:preprotein translocase subunit SecD